MWKQFGAIILSEPVVGPVEMVEGGGWEFCPRPLQNLAGAGESD
jgi:hypothetical protein